MSISILPASARTEAKKEPDDSLWTGNLTKSEADFLLDRLEDLGFRNLEVRCTVDHLFAICIPPWNG